MNEDVIRLLPDSVANQIAAGEVIQRPASVIKELVENAVDAGADMISIILKDAGRTLIQVVDNGCGMSPSDARMAFERHATSKISSANDLYSLHTMGFRGEALASIAAVAQVELRTMRRDDTVGTRLLISESHYEGQEPASCVSGTNLMVKNIFFHMPARRKFLKKDSIELNHILREFERLALVNTGIDFTLIHNDVTLHQFMRGSLKQRISDLFGKNMGSQLATVATDTSIVRIDGFIGLPRFARKRGYQQFLFVNGRYMRHPFFHKAVLRCYENLIAPDAQPSYFINFNVDPSTIDVNIHPQKYEIKFEQEQAIWQILEAAIKEVLGKTQAAGALDFDSEDTFDIPLFQPDSTAATPDDGGSGGFNPFSDPSPAGWEQLYENFNSHRGESSVPERTTLRPAALNTTTSGGGETVLRPSRTVAPPDPALFEVPQPELAPTASCIQLQNRYIVSPTNSGLMLIAQHRAHVRILFDRFMAQFAGGEMASQKLIFAEDIELSPAQAATLRGRMATIKKLGFQVSDNGNNRWSVNAVPASLSGLSATEALLSVIADEPGGDDASSLIRPLAMAMAEASAVRHQQTLSQEEMEAITADLFRCSDPSYTPAGLPIMSIISNDEISRRFETL